MAVPRGVCAASITKDDFVVSLGPVSADDSEKMLSVSEQGMASRRRSRPIGSIARRQGVKHENHREDRKVVAVFPVDADSEIMIITQQGKLIRIEADSIRKTGRSAQGVRLIKTDGGDKVTSASLVEAATEIDEEEVE